MIRIETIAEFDTDGRFSASGQATQSVSQGAHRVIIFVDDEPASVDSTALDADPLPDAEMDIVAMIESVRRERDEHILGHPLP
ncbi:MAG: hypothetical protein Q8K78_18090 [Planctomycetaceae bacterium]|nr:hypothetical protein [Planctomycetaceae bacterium]